MSNKIVSVICIMLLGTAIFLLSKVFLGTKDTYRKDHLLENTFKHVKTDPLTEIAFEENLINVGDVSQDTVIQREYTLINIGNNPLLVYNVIPDCNCTDYHLSKKSVLPKDSLVICLVVDTKNKRIGNFMLNTVVELNTKKQHYRLRMIGNVVKK